MVFRRPLEGLCRVFEGVHKVFLWAFFFYRVFSGFSNGFSLGFIVSLRVFMRLLEGICTIDVLFVCFS